VGILPERRVGTNSVDPNRASANGKVVNFHPPRQVSGSTRPAAFKIRRSGVFCNYIVPFYNEVLASAITFPFGYPA
jgi:hypothetical protein